MKICRYDDNRIGVVNKGYVEDITAIVDSQIAQVPDNLRGDRLIEALPGVQEGYRGAGPHLRRHRIEDVCLRSPVEAPTKILGAPGNFARHVEESIADPEIAQIGAIKTVREVGFFLKANSSLVGFGDGIQISFPERRTDHEAEIVVVVGSVARNISAALALKYVAGLSLGLDVTLRGQEERSLRKSLDTYTVLGPWLTTMDEIDGEKLVDVDFGVKVNLEARQHELVKNMLVGIPELISLASSYYTLFPGDLIYCGAPVGVGSIRPGDVLTVFSSELGRGKVQVQ